MVTFLINPYFVAIGIPIIFVMSGAAGKKLVRGKKGWRRSDFYLGTELSLGSLSASLIQIFDLLKLAPSQGASWPPKLPLQIGASAGFTAVCFFAFIWILSTHQDWHDAADNDKNRQIAWLGIGCNLIGSALMFIFILGVKGV